MTYSITLSFITAIRNHPVLHWGGDFGDPVHIDDGLNRNNPDIWKQKLAIIQSKLTGLTVGNKTKKALGL